ncbi:hypothetical protein MtrunA17_Chr5g0443841 [Medicago truncatula]|uniref:Uncharacterized protein n=1 Tax=Medicago truncatula TaxID=3880 RepID=A0A396I0Q7_MEDTR|nr:hypothetical protein MtrunA17_Chr5g0443841 [Medicago truncatula]
MVAKEFTLTYELYVVLVRIFFLSTCNTNEVSVYVWRNHSPVNFFEVYRSLNNVFHNQEISGVLDDSSNTSLKVITISALEVLAEKFLSNGYMFCVCLGSITGCMASHNLDVTFLPAFKQLLHNAFIKVLGAKSLTELPLILNNMKSYGIAFDMLAELIVTMDRSSIVPFHGNI